jgi:hypothetical protein
MTDNTNPIDTKKWRAVLEAVEPSDRPGVLVRLYADFLRGPGDEDEARTAADGLRLEFGISEKAIVDEWRKLGVSSPCCIEPGAGDRRRQQSDHRPPSTPASLNETAKTSSASPPRVHARRGGHFAGYRGRMRRGRWRQATEASIFGLFANNTILEGAEHRDTVAQILKAHHAKPLSWSSR